MRDKNNLAEEEALLAEVKPFAEIEVGPAKHEQFLDQHYKKIVLILLAVTSVFGGAIIYSGVKADQEAGASAALCAVVTKAMDKGFDSQSLEPITTTGTKAAETAKYLQSIALFDAGKAEEGIAALQSFISTTSSAEMKAQAQLVLGYRLMKDGKLEEATACFEQVAKSDNHALAPTAFLVLGDIARTQGDTARASAYYTDLMEKYPDSAPARVALPVRVDLLGVKDPAKVAPSTTPTNTDLPSVPSFLNPGSPLSPGLPSGDNEIPALFK